MNWFGFCATAGLPPAIAARWVAELRAVLAMPEVTERLSGLGVEGTNMDPAMMTSWPVASGLGGAAGAMIGGFGIQVGQSMLGVIGRGLTTGLYAAS